MPEAMLVAYMASNERRYTKQSHKARLSYIIPKDNAAWLEYLVNLVKSKIVIKYLSDKEVKKIIARTRSKLAPKKFSLVRDPDAPESLYWDQNQVADWVGESGYPHLRDAFLLNCINGRKLIDVDASALNKMGLKDFREIKSLAVKIRNVLELNRPNMLRAIMRRVPLKLFLQRARFSGRTYDLLTFREFCETNGFPYSAVVNNKCALIAECCNVLLSPAGKDESESNSEGSTSDLSLVNAPSVEYLVRRQVIRNRTIDQILGHLLDGFLDFKDHMIFGQEMDRMMQRLVEEGFLELGFSDPSNYTREKVGFATAVGEELIRELLRSVEVLNDQNEFREQLRQEKETPEHYEEFRTAAENFLDSALPVAANYLLGCYSLESIFRDQPEFLEFVNSITDEAEQKTNEQVDLAETVVNEVISEADLRVLAHRHYPYSSLDAVRTAKHLASDIIDSLLYPSSGQETQQQQMKTIEALEQPQRPTTAPANKSVVKFDVGQAQPIYEGQQNQAWNIGHVTITQNRDHSKPRSELTSIGSPKSLGGQKERKLYSSTTSVPSSGRSMDFSTYVSSRPSRVQSEHLELEPKTVPKLKFKEKNGFSFNESNKCIGELNEYGRGIVIKGQVVGQMNKTGVAFNLERKVGQVKNMEKGKSLSRGGFRIGLGPIKEDSHLQRQNNRKLRPATVFERKSRPSTAPERKSRPSTAPEEKSRPTTAPEEKSRPSIASGPERKLRPSTALGPERKSRPTTAAQGKVHPTTVSQLKSRPATPALHFYSQEKWRAPSATTPTITNRKPYYIWP